MRKFFLSVAFVSTALTAIPAMAQDYGRQGSDQRDDRYGDRDRDNRYGDRNDRYGDRDQYGRGDWNRGPSRHAVFELMRDLDRIEFRIERLVQRGNLSRREAYGLRRDATQIRFQLRRAQRDGIGGRELGALRFQVNRLEQRLRSERDDRDGRRY